MRAANSIDIKTLFKVMFTYILYFSKPHIVFTSFISTYDNTVEKLFESVVIAGLKFRKLPDFAMR